MNAKLVKQSDEMQRAIETILTHAPEFDLWHFAEWFEIQNGFKPSEAQTLEQLQFYVEEFEAQ